MRVSAFVLVCGRVISEARPCGNLLETCPFLEVQSKLETDMSKRARLLWVQMWPLAFGLENLCNS